MAANDHRIRRQLWQVRARTQAEAFALRQRLRAAWADSLAPVFARAFDARAGADTVVHLPRLHLRVQVPPGEDPMARLPELVARALDEQWPRTVAPQRPAPVEGPSAAHATRDAARTSAVEPRDGAATALDDLLTYLDTGHLPWHLAGRPADETRTHLSELARRQRELVFGRWHAKPPTVEALARLFQLTPTAAWPELTHAFVACAPLPAAATDAMIAEIQQAIAVGVTPLRLAQRLLAPPTLARRPFAPRSTEPNLTPTPEARLPVSSRARPPRSAHRASHIPRAKTAEALRAHDTERSPAEATYSPAPPTAAAEFPHEPPRSPAATMPYAHHVPHAGLVLLHPFLPRFFTATGVMAETARRPSDDALPRAATLLHLLATGGDAPPCDFELPLIRVLLGRAPDDPLQADAPCAAQDRAEADALLQSVIAHWSALRSTSPRGLRTTFLQRPGLLRAIDAGWLLQLERGPFDVLLDRLPWALGVIKLPWMPRPLHTEW